MKYTFEYLFGFPGKSGAKALLGTIFHKTQELRAQASLAIKNHKYNFVDDNFGEVLVSDALKTPWALRRSFDYYTKKNPQFDMGDKEYKIIDQWIYNALHDYYQYDPLNLNVIQTEQFFDIEIKEPWAKYKGIIKGEEVSGYLRIKGTMDLISEVSDDTYELIDYKSGEMRSDFATGEEKTLDYLENDVQLLLYLIALKHLWPTKHWILSLFYIRAGGIFSVIGDDEMLERAKAMVQKMFKEISTCEIPTQLDPYHRDWRCKHLCPFSKSDSYTRGQSICNHYKAKIERKGLQAIQDEVMNVNKLFNYQEGGGRPANE
jgi:hypothetical protein